MNRKSKFDTFEQKLRRYNWALWRAPVIQLNCKLQTNSSEDAGSKLSHVFRMLTLKVGPQTKRIISDWYTSVKTKLHKHTKHANNFSGCDWLEESRRHANLNRAHTHKLNYSEKKRNMSFCDGELPLRPADPTMTQGINL